MQRDNTHITKEQLYEKKEKYYKRNFFTFMCESFFFSAALSMFSAESVLPSYVANLSDKSIYIALISVIYYGVSYGATFFSCPIGVNAKSPKWISIAICFLQRVGFFFIFLSTYMVSGSRNISLFLFFMSLIIFALSNGMSTPLFSQAVSASLHKNIGTFYGFYGLVGAGSGILGSLILTRCLTIYDFPKDYRTAFLIGLVSALIATCAMSIGIKEVTDDRESVKISLKDVIPISRKILSENTEFSYFTIIKVILGAAEFAIPYYIIIASLKPDTPDGFVGIMSTIYLIAKMIYSLFVGRIGDKCGPIAMLLTSCFFGVLAALLAITAPNWQLTIPMYIFLAFATNGILLANNTACVVYSRNKFVPIYNTTVSLLSAPIYIIVSFGGAKIADTFSYNAMFALAFAVYLTGMILCIYFRKKAAKTAAERRQL
ncbi:MAG TPA: MFS transporter [Candidatus Mediterraneibacter norfolkensis]|nr:MFS transporter [Candidatus Mediterraneibacter norfolkensis]